MINKITTIVDNIIDGIVLAMIDCTTQSRHFLLPYEYIDKEID